MKFSRIILAGFGLAGFTAFVSVTLAQVPLPPRRPALSVDRPTGAASASRPAPAAPTYQAITSPVPAELNPRDKAVFQVSIDHDQPVPVYNRAGEPVYYLAPGEFFGVIGDLDDQALLLNGRDDHGNRIELFLKKEDSFNTYIALGEARKNVHVDLPQGQTATLRKDPRHTDIDCLMDPSNCETKVDAKSGIEIEDAVFQIGTDPDRLTSSTMDNQYKVKSLIDSQSQGWMRAGESSVRPRVFRPTAKEEDCEHTTLGQGAVVPKSSILPLQDVLNHEFDKVVSTVIEHTGKCFSYDGEGGLFRRKVVPDFKDRVNSLPALKKEDGTAVTPADWVAMDALARTLYGEMASCFRKGEHYPQAVAKVVLNRKDFITDPKHAKQGAQFAKGSNTPFENEITRALLHPWQFSVWNSGDLAGRLAICPPSSPNKKFWNGPTPSENEVGIWRKAVEIAARAVLTEKSFKNSTSDLKSLFYTSNMDAKRMVGKGFRMETGAAAGGEPLSNTRCVQIWNAFDISWRAPDEYVRWLLKFSRGRSFVGAHQLTCPRS